MSAKLSAFYNQGLLQPGSVEVTCLLLHDGTPIDEAATTVAANQTEALSLASTVVAGTPSNVVVSCMAGDDLDVEASSIQLIAVRVDTVQVLP